MPAVYSVRNCTETSLDVSSQKSIDFWLLLHLSAQHLTEGVEDEGFETAGFTVASVDILFGCFLVLCCELVIFKMINRNIGNEAYQKLGLFFLWRFP